MTCNFPNDDGIRGLRRFIMGRPRYYKFIPGAFVAEQQERVSVVGAGERRGQKNLIRAAIFI
jgi:hypothetical protein